MKKYVDKDEYYPFYSLHDKTGGDDYGIDFSEEDITFIENAMTNFYKAQRIIKRKLEEVSAPSPSIEAMVKEKKRLATLAKDTEKIMDGE